MVINLAGLKFFRRLSPTSTRAIIMGRVDWTTNMRPWNSSCALLSISEMRKTEIQKAELAA
jgi:hypothetical protein